MKILTVTLLVIGYILLPAQTNAQTELIPLSGEKIMKKGPLVGLQYRSKYGKGVVPTEYDSLKGTSSFVLAYKNGRVDVYKRRIFLDSYLKSILPGDIPMVISMNQLDYDRGAELIYEKGLWGWVSNRGRFEVTARYDSIKPFSNWYYKVYKGGKVALAELNNKLLVSFTGYEIEERKIDKIYLLSAKDTNTGVELLGMYLDSAHFIQPRYQRVDKESFISTISYNNAKHFGWIKAITPNKKVDYYHTWTLKPYTTEDAAAILAISKKNDAEQETYENRKKEIYSKLHVFRNEQGKLGILDAEGHVIVPPGFDQIYSGNDYNKSVSWKWVALPGSHGLRFSASNLKDTVAKFAGDTMILFREGDKLLDPVLFFTDSWISMHPDLSLAPKGGFKTFARHNKCTACNYGKVSARSYKVNEDYEIAPAKTETKTEKLISRDLDNDGKFPTRTTTIHTPATMGTRSRTEYIPEHTCEQCNGKGYLVEALEWKDKLQKFEKRSFGATADPYPIAQ